MKIVTRYVCEVCGKSHEREEDCKMCEATHPQIKVKKVEYSPFDPAIPVYLELETSDGHVFPFMSYRKELENCESEYTWNARLRSFERYTEWR